MGEGLGREIVRIEGSLWVEKGEHKGKGGEREVERRLWRREGVS